jgi:formate-dependent nitrite reductase membrane component NrfD
VIEKPPREAASYTPDDVAASMARGDGGFGRDQQSYYDHPILQKPHWGWEIEWYFYVGGLASGSALLAMVADQSGQPASAPLVRNGRYTAMIGAAASGLLLILDLGRPERFLNMLRIIKLKSPMSVGVYALMGFSMTAGLAAAEQLHADGVLPLNLARVFPKILRLFAIGANSALLGSYTGVLISATAIPVWFSGRRFLPAIFVCSATSTACALQLALLALAPGSHVATMRKLERLETFAAFGEVLLLHAYRRSAKSLGDPLFRGALGKRLHVGTEVFGIAVPLLLNLSSGFSKSAHDGPVHRGRALLAAGLTLFGGYMLRTAVLRAGKVSADDPRAYINHMNPS